MHVDTHVDDYLMQNGWFPFLFSYLFQKLKSFWTSPIFFQLRITLSMHEMLWWIVMDVCDACPVLGMPPVHLQLTFIFFLKGSALNLELLGFQILCSFTHSFFTLTYICFLQDTGYQSLTWPCLNRPFWVFDSHFLFWFRTSFRVFALNPVVVFYFSFWIFLWFKPLFRVFTLNLSFFILFFYFFEWTAAVPLELAFSYLPFWLFKISL